MLFIRLTLLFLSSNFHIFFCNTIYLNISYQNSQGAGSQLDPFNSFPQALLAIENDPSAIIIIDNSQNESLIEISQEFTVNFTLEIE